MKYLNHKLFFNLTIVKSIKIISSAFVRYLKNYNIPF